MAFVGLFPELVVAIGRPIIIGFIPCFWAGVFWLGFRLATGFGGILGNAIGRWHNVPGDPAFPAQDGGDQISLSNG